MILYDFLNNLALLRLQYICWECEVTAENSGSIA